MQTEQNLHCHITAVRKTEHFAFIYRLISSLDLAFVIETILFMFSNYL